MEPIHYNIKIEFSFYDTAPRSGSPPLSLAVGSAIFGAARAVIGLGWARSGNQELRLGRVPQMATAGYHTQQSSRKSCRFSLLGHTISLVAFFSEQNYCALPDKCIPELVWR